MLHVNPWIGALMLRFGIEIEAPLGMFMLVKTRWPGRIARSG